MMMVDMILIIICDLLLEDKSIIMIMVRLPVQSYVYAIWDLTNRIALRFRLVLQLDMNLRTSQSVILL